MFHVVLVEPEIPPNTGNVIRLCANSGAQLHLVEPLGFSLDDRQLRRAGLDYHEYATVKCHASFDELLQSAAPPMKRMFALTTRASQNIGATDFEAGDWFVFGCETRGLPDHIRAHFPETQRLRLPMKPGVRSLNLSNAVAVTVYEAWRQTGFKGAG